MAVEVQLDEIFLTKNCLKLFVIFLIKLTCIWRHPFVKETKSCWFDIANAKLPTGKTKPKISTGV